MKPHFIIIPIACIAVTLVSTLLTYQVFSYYQPSTIASTNPSTPLVLEAFPSPVMSPKVTYNPNLGIVESVDTPEIADKLVLYNSRLNKIYQNPLNISLKDGNTTTDLILDSSFIRTILIPKSTELNVPPEVNKLQLLSYITSRLTQKQKKYFNPNVAYLNTKNAINLRFMGEVTPIVLGVDDGPSSNGELADRYLEIDISQQKMYFFIDHTLYKEYRVSTGIDYPTPVGEFHILNKAPKAFSDIYNVWMPYWMGFTYARDVGAYLGIHEIAYAVDAKGKPFYKHGYYIGEMFTGGCIAMEPKDSREIYDLSDVGMLVRVVK
jgi:hypothetical protein